MATKTIMLNCVAGMSTSLLVKKMQEAAKAQGKDYEIFACPASEADNKLANQEINCVLLGPQVGYMKADFEKKLEGTGIPMGVIPMQDYGMMNGKKVLEFADGLMAE